MYLQKAINNELHKILNSNIHNNLVQKFVDELNRSEFFKSIGCAFDYWLKFDIASIPMMIYSGKFAWDNDRYPIKILLTECSNNLYVPNQIKEKKKSEILFDLSKIIQHELIHKFQFESGGNNFERYYNYFYPSEDMKGYLSHKDEIDAYAHDICLEVTRKNPQGLRDDIVQNIKMHSQSYRDYTKVFPPNHKVMKRLLKKVVKYSEFDTSHWN